MEISRVLRKSLLPTAAAIVLSMGVSSGVVRADGEFLTPFNPAYPPLASGGVIGYQGFVNGFTIAAGAISPGVPLIPIVIPGLSAGALFDVDGDGNTNDERCDADAEADQQFGLAAASSADTLGNTICNAITPETVESPCWIAFGIVQQLIVVGQTVAKQCEFQDALVDGAEIEAGFENTVKLIALNTKLYESQLESNLLNCTAVVGLILPEANGGLAEWVETFVQDRIDQYTPVINDSDRIVRAQDNLDQGNIDFAAGLFEDAYRRYCKAYGSLVAGKGRG